MASGPRPQRGFSLIELVLVVALASALMAISLPLLNGISESSKLNRATREVERELQSARLKAVSVNRSLRVRLNCPAPGYFRTVEVVSPAVDSASNRCLPTAYPFPPADADLTSRPNFDGPLRVLPHGATVSNGSFEFRSDGTVYAVVSNTAQAIATQVTITVSRSGKSRTLMVNGAGRIRLQ